MKYLIALLAAAALIAGPFLAGCSTGASVNTPIVDVGVGGSVD